jgi:hypothetical protein
MPLNSGPTQLLPYSQHFDNGYIAYRHPSFKKVFHEMMVQLPLEKGDGLFFNPALFHAAGENTTKDFKRSANLLQISACWGKPMESVDRRKILEVIWPVLSDVRNELGEGRVKALFKMVADGYSFPTNLDKDPPPAGGVSLVSLSESASPYQYLSWKLIVPSTVRRHNWTWYLEERRKGGVSSNCGRAWRHWMRGDYHDAERCVPYHIMVHMSILSTRQNSPWRSALVWWSHLIPSLRSTY